MPRLGILTPFKHPAYRHLFVSIIGNSLAIFFDFLGTFTLIAYQWEGDSFAVAAFTSCYAVPLVVLSPFAGTIVDRLPTLRGVLAYASLGCAVMSAMQWLAPNLPALLVVVILKNGARMLINPANMAALRSAIPEAELSQALSLSHLVRQVSKIAAPAIGGLLLAVIAPGSLFLVVALCYFVSFLGFMTLPRDLGRGRSKQGPRPPFLTDWVNGVRLFLRDRLLLVGMIGMSLATFSVFLADSQLPLLAKEYGLSARQYGIAISTIGAGGAVGAILVGSLSHLKRPTVLLGLGILGDGLGLLGFTLSESLASALPFSQLHLFCGAGFLMGLAAAFEMVGFDILVQTRSGVDEAGRATGFSNSVNGLFMFAAPPLGAIVAARYSVVAPFYFTVVGMCTAAALVLTGGLVSRWLKRPAAP